jgi:hypothetical protein
VFPVLGAAGWRQELHAQWALLRLEVAAALCRKQSDLPARSAPLAMSPAEAPEQLELPDAEA